MLRSICDLTKAQFDTELQKGIDDIAAGRVLSADAVESEMRTLFASKCTENHCQIRKVQK